MFSYSVNTSRINMTEAGPFDQEAAEKKFPGKKVFQAKHCVRVQQKMR